jgi:hypothetical protein
LPSNEVSFIDAPVAKRRGMNARYLSLVTNSNLLIY